MDEPRSDFRRTFDCEVSRENHIQSWKVTRSKPLDPCKDAFDFGDGEIAAQQRAFQLIKRRATANLGQQVNEIASLKATRLGVLVDVQELERGIDQVVDTRRQIRRRAA